MNPYDSTHKENKDNDINTNEEDTPYSVIEEIYTDGAIRTGIFNEIMDLKQKGNDLFSLNKFKESINCYEAAVELCIKQQRTMDLSILYSNISLAYQKLDMFEKSLEFCTEALNIDENYVKPRVRRAFLYEKVEKLESAIEDYEYLLKLEYQPHVVNQKIMELKQKVDERNEQLKEDMLSKLKQLGNTFLKPFGLSTDNFKSLMEVYTKMLGYLEKMPSNYGYRKTMIPKVNSYIDICKNKSVKEMEQIHDVVEIEAHMFQVKCELDLMKNMLETKDWEPFSQPSPPNQYKWP